MIKIDKKPIIENIELGIGKKNSKNSIDDENNQSSILKTIGDAIISPAAAAEIDLSERYNKLPVP